MSLLTKLFDVAGDHTQLQDIKISDASLARDMGMLKGLGRSCDECNPFYRGQVEHLVMADLHNVCWTLTLTKFEDECIQC